MIKLLRPISILTPLLVFLLVSIAGPLTSYATNTNYPYPNSDGDFSESELKDIEAITSFIDNCLNENNIETKVSTEAAKAGDIFKNADSYYVSDYVDNGNNSRECKAQAKGMTSKLYGSIDKFIKAFFGKPPSNCTDDGTWYLKGFLVETPIRKTDCTYDGNRTLYNQQVYEGTKEKALDKGYYKTKSQMPPEYAYNVLRPKFTECFEKWDSEGIENPDRTIQGKKWVYKNGEGGDIYIGQILKDSGDDGRISCKELGDYINKDSNGVGYVILTREEIAAQNKEGQGEEDEEQKRKDIWEVLNSNKVEFKKCLAGTPLASLSLDDSLNAVSRWLAKGGTGSITYTDDNGKELTIGVDQSAWIKGCLENNPTFGNKLTKIIERDPTDPVNPDDPIDSSSKVSDDCLSKSDQFLAWFACPVINLIDSFLESIEDIIKNLLKFNITGDIKEGNVNENEYLRDAWNIFRSLATILIMAGFLLALLVKAIKGE